MAGGVSPPAVLLRREGVSIMPLHGVRPFACHCEEVVATDEAISKRRDCHAFGSQ